MTELNAYLKTLIEHRQDAKVIQDIKKQIEELQNLEINYIYLKEDIDEIIKNAVESIKSHELRRSVNPSGPVDPRRSVNPIRPVNIVKFNPQGSGSICRISSIQMGLLLLRGELKLNDITEQNPQFVNILRINPVLLDKTRGVDGKEGLTSEDIQRRLDRDVEETELLEISFGLNNDIKDLEQKIRRSINGNIDKNCTLSFTIAAHSFSITLFNRQIIFIDTHSDASPTDSKAVCIIADSIDTLFNNEHFKRIIRNIFSIVNIALQGPGPHNDMQRMQLQQLDIYKYTIEEKHYMQPRQPNPYNKYLKYKIKYMNLVK